MSQNLARTARAEAALSERESYAQAVRFGTGEQDVVSYDILHNPEHRAKLLEMSLQHAGSPRAALIETESFMAAHALARTPVHYTDGTSVNWGRQAVSAVYDSAENASSVIRIFRESIRASKQRPARMC